MSDERHSLPPTGSGDPQGQEPKVADLSAKRKIADEAAELLDEKGVFMGAVRAVRLKWFRELLDTNDRELIAKLHANLQALDAIPQVLQTAINDYKMAADRGRRHA